MPPHALTIDEVRKVATLARLRLSDTQLEQYRHQLGAVLDYMNRLRSLDLASVEPMTSPLNLTNRLAEDEPGPTLTTQALMAICPAPEPPFVSVPKVVGEGA